MLCRYHVVILFTSLVILFISCTRSNATRVPSENEKWGVVISDYFEEYPTELNPRVLRFLSRFTRLSPNIPCELWLRKDAIIPRNLTILYPNVHIERFSSHIQERSDYGYISKAYALLHSRFKLPVYFDTEVYFCSSEWIDKVNEAISIHPYSNVLWTIEDCHWCGYPNRNSTMFISSRIFPYIEEYSRYSERNTGTILAIRKNMIGYQFLKRAIQIWHSWRTRKNWVFGTDQSPFREAAFVMRTVLNETILNSAVFCRTRGSTYTLEDCQCNTCLLVHLLEFFEFCPNSGLPVKNPLFKFFTRVGKIARYIFHQFF